MNNIKKFLRDIYEGIYFVSLRYEANSFSKSTILQRFIVTFYLYYFSIVVLLIGIKVTFDKPFKLNPFEAIMYAFGIYSLIYIFIINPITDRSDVDINTSDEIKKKKIKKYNLTIYGGFAFFLLSILIVYFLYKK